MKKRGEGCCTFSRVKETGEKEKTQLIKLHVNVKKNAGSSLKKSKKKC